jgi:glutamate carboxypeptidase
MVQPSVLLDAARQLAPDMLDRLRTLVSCESAPGSVPHLESCADLLAGWGEAILGRPARRVVVDGLPHLLWPVADQRVLLLGHFDTVFGCTGPWRGGSSSILTGVGQGKEQPGAAAAGAP